MALRLLLLPAAVLNMIALAAATAGAADSDSAGLAMPPPSRTKHDHPHHRAVHHRKHLSRRRIKHGDHREAPAYAARQVRDSREAHRRWFQRMDDPEGELVRRAEPSSNAVICLGTAGAYQQCGGMGYSGDTCCIAGYSCVVGDAWCETLPFRLQSGTGHTKLTTSCPTDSQCKPIATTTTTTSAASSTTSSASPSQSPTGCTGAQVAYGQCGGVGYTGDTCCPTGYYCSYGNPYCASVLASSPFGPGSDSRFHIASGECRVAM